MKKILIIAHFCNDFDTTGNNRFNYLANLLSADYDVKFVTTDFSHRKKAYRTPVENNSFEIKMIHEPAYKKNISLKRLYAHRILGGNLTAYFNTLTDKPDVIYCAIPSLDVARAAAKYAEKNNIRLIIDIQDLWPEAFQMVLNVPFIFGGMKRTANSIYNSTNDIVAVSKTYLQRAKLTNSKINEDNVVYIGTDLDSFRENVSLYLQEKKDENELWIGYCGSLSKSYDIKCVIDAIAVLQSEGYDNLIFKIMGNGSLRGEFQSYAEQKNVKAEFLGHVPYPQMCGLISSCDISVNPIVAKSAGSIINKHADYAAAGIPVVNSQENVEYRELVEEYNMGLNCINSDPVDMAAKIKKLIDSPDLRKEMGRNALKCAQEKFDRKYTYKKILELINK